MIMDNKRIGFLRIPSRDIYHSASEAERGKLASQVTTHFVRVSRGVSELYYRVSLIYWT